MTTRMVVLDTETTGLDPQQGHRITEIACVELLDRRLTGRQFQTYLNPERELDEAAARITGLSYAILKDKPKFAEVVESFMDFVFSYDGDEVIEKTELVIHNAPFDLKFLNHELLLCGHQKRPLENHVGVIDTLILARKLHPGHRRYNLDALCERHGIDNSHREKHGALLDAEILSEVYLKMTAGQLSLAFEGLTEKKNQDITVKSDVQQASVPRITSVSRSAFKVIYASPEALSLHEARLLELAQKS